MNLLALLPPDIRLEVQKREGAILKSLLRREGGVLRIKTIRRARHEMKYYKMLSAKS